MDNFKCPIFTQGLVLAKNAKIIHRVLSKLVNKPDLTFQKLAEDCQKIVSVRKDSKIIKESGVAYVRKVKHRSQSYSLVKERKNTITQKNMITQNFNTGRLGTTKKKKNTQRLLPLRKITLGQGLSLSYKKMSKLR